MEQLIEQYQTSDVKISAYLLTCDIPLIRVIKDNPSRVLFCFSPNPRIKSYLQEYWTNRATSNPKALFDNFEYLKGLIHNDYDL